MLLATKKFSFPVGLGIKRDYNSLDNICRFTYCKDFFMLSKYGLHLHDQKGILSITILKISFLVINKKENRMEEVQRMMLFFSCYILKRAREYICAQFHVFRDVVCLLIFHGRPFLPSHTMSEDEEKGERNKYKKNGLEKEEEKEVYVYYVKFVLAGSKRARKRHFVTSRYQMFLCSFPGYILNASADFYDRHQTDLIELSAGGVVYMYRERHTTLSVHAGISLTKHTYVS